MKKRILILIITIVLIVICMTLYFLIHKDNMLDTLIFGKKYDSPYATTPCQDYTGIERCIYYKSGDLHIERLKTGNDDYYEYFINGHSIGNMSVHDVIVYDNYFVLLDTGLDGSEYYIYDKDGHLIESQLDDNIKINIVVYSNNKFTISGTLVDDNVANICTYRPLDTIVYMQKEIIYGDEIKENLLDSTTLKEYAKQHYNTDCDENVVPNLTSIYKEGNINIGKDANGAYYINNNLIGYYECSFDVEKQIDVNHVLVDNGCISDSLVIYNKDGKEVTNFNKMSNINNSCLEVDSVIDDLYIIANTSCTESNYKVYHKNGKEVVFAGFENMPIVSAKMTLKNLTLVGSLIDDNVQDVCNYKPLDTIIYLKKSVSYSNTLFGEPITIEQKTLKEYAKEKLNIDCE